MAKLEDAKTSIRVKLSALWSSVMFLYVYGDYFNMYTPGKLERMAAGSLGFGPANEGALVGVAALMAVPSLMIAGAVLLPAPLCKWLNVALGLAYSAIMALTMNGAPLFYVCMGVAEILLTLSIAWIALRWAKSQV